MKLFRQLLIEYCRNRGTTLQKLAKKLHINPAYLSMLGTTCGISIHMVNEIVDKLKLTDVEEIDLRHAAVYSQPRKKPIIVNAAFLRIISNEIMYFDTPDDGDEAVVRAVLKFTGIKFRQRTSSI